MAKYLSETGAEHLVNKIKENFAEKEEIKIKSIKRNGITLSPHSMTKEVNIVVPTKTSDLTNNSNFITQSQLNQAVSNISKITKQVVDTLPQTGTDNVIYLKAKNGENGNVFDEYMWINNKYEKIGDTATTVEIQSISNSEIDALFD